MHTNKFVLSIVLLMVVGAGCRASDDVDPTEIPVSASPALNPIATPAPIPTSTSVLVATVVANPEITPAPTPGSGSTSVPVTPTPSPTPVVPQTPPAGTARISLSEFNSSICVLDSKGKGGGFGTAPAPTATPVAADGTSGDDGTVSESAYLSRAQSIANNLSTVSTDFEYLWTFDLDPQQQAAALMILEVRINQLCEATSILEPPTMFVGIHSRLSEVVRVRHAWSALAIEQLDKTGSARSEFLIESQVSTHALTDQIRAELERLSGGSNSDSSIVMLDQFEIELTLPPDWYVFGAERHPLISAPAALQLAGLTGLGPSGWNTGVSLRIRRFRIFDSMSSQEATDRFGGLITSLGNPVEQSSGTLFDADAIFTSVLDSERSWKFTVITVVEGDYVYAIDYGCPQSQLGWCAELNEVAIGLQKQVE